MKHSHSLRSLFGASLMALGLYSLIVVCAIIPFWKDYPSLRGWALGSQAVVDAAYLAAYLLLLVVGGFLCFDKGNKQKVVDALFFAFGVVSLFGYFFDYATIIAYYTNQSNGEGITIALPLHAMLPFGYLLAIGVALEVIAYFEKRSAVGKAILQAIGVATSLLYYGEFILYWMLADPASSFLYGIVAAVGVLLLLFSYVTLTIAYSLDYQDFVREKERKN
jgi:hypothetical protein